MSRRFGRNQRRKLREAAEQAERKAAYWCERESAARHTLNERYERLERKMAEWARRIDRHTPPGSPFRIELEARTFKSRGEARRYSRAYNPPPIPLSYAASPMVEAAGTIIDLFAIYCDVMDDDMTMRRLIRIEMGQNRPYGPDAQVLGYVMDGRTYSEARRDPRWLEMMAHDIVEKLMREWGKNPSPEQVAENKR